MSDSWWARRLGGGAPSSAPVPPAPNGFPSKAVRWEQSYPPTGPRQEVVAQPEGDGDSTYHRVQRQGYDTKAPPSKSATGACPSCGGSNFFRRRMGNVEAAPLCTDCGYNGDYFTQSGTLLNSVGLRSSGPVQFARSDNPGGERRFEVDANLAATDWNPSVIR
jgi:hypothetical protein